MERVLIRGMELAGDPCSLVNRVTVAKQHVLGNTEGHANAAQRASHFKLHLLVSERGSAFSHTFVYRGNTVAQLLYSNIDTKLTYFKIVN